MSRKQRRRERKEEEEEQTGNKQIKLNQSSSTGAGTATATQSANYNDYLFPLRTLLSRNNSTPASFSGGGMFNANIGSLALSIDSIGIISLPLTESQANLIKKAATLAPFGRKDQTLIDQKVRHTWQVSPSSVTIGHPRWETTLINTLLPRITTDLGIDSPYHSLIQFSLYKLLLYETGSHFTLHRDTEKVPGMFATLSIILPSIYTGGECKIKHKNESKLYDLTIDNGCLDYNYLVFYTDCEHEILPITSGYRLALVYNVLYKGSPQSIPTPALEKSELVEQIKLALSTFSRKGKDPILLPLSHQYSEEGSSAGLTSLKGEDRKLAEIIVAAANNNEGENKQISPSVFVFSALFERYESGSRIDSEGEMEDLCEEESTVGSFNLLFQPSSSLPIQWEKLDISLSVNEEKQVLFPSDFDWGNEEADEQEENEDTGNEGSTAERWYRIGVLVIMPYDSLFDVISKTEKGADLFVQLLMNQLKNLDEVSDQLTFQEKASEIIKLVNLILQSISRSEKPRKPWDYSTPAPRSTSSLFPCLSAIVALHHHPNKRDQTEKSILEMMSTIASSTLFRHGWKDKSVLRIIEKLIDQWPSGFNLLKPIILTVNNFSSSPYSLQSSASDEFKFIAECKTASSVKLSQILMNQTLTRMANEIKTYSNRDSSTSLKSTSLQSPTERTLIEITTVSFPQLKVAYQAFSTIFLSPVSSTSSTSTNVVVDPELFSSSVNLFERMVERCLKIMQEEINSPPLPPPNWTLDSSYGSSFAVDKTKETNDFLEFLKDPVKRVFTLKAVEKVRKNLSRFAEYLSKSTKECLEWNTSTTSTPRVLTVTKSKHQISASLIREKLPKLIAECNQLLRQVMEAKGEASKENPKSKNNLLGRQTERTETVKSKPEDKFVKDFILLDD